MKSKALIASLATIAILAPSLAHASTDTALTSRLRGYILLQVESHGEAWYVNPTDDSRYYMKDGPTAYEMMRKFGLGITEADFAKLEAGDKTLVDRLKGRIVLRVELHGEAYYVHPSLGTIHYLKDGEAAYTVMRELSLGIKNTDLERIVTREVTVTVNTETNTNTEETSEETREEVVFEAPSGIDLDELNAYWLQKVNALRAEKGLSTLETDTRLRVTATSWADYLGENSLFTHTRPNNESMNDWVDALHLDFTAKGVTGGWTTNYFSENIGWGYSTKSTESAEATLDDILDMMLAEGPGGDHYDTIYHPDWNSVGLGFDFTPAMGGKYKMVAVMHYASLK